MHSCVRHPHAFDIFATRRGTTLRGRAASGGCSRPEKQVSASGRGPPVDVVTVSQKAEIKSFSANVHNHQRNGISCGAVAPGRDAVENGLLHFASAHGR